MGGSFRRIIPDMIEAYSGLDFEELRGRRGLLVFVDIIVDQIYSGWELRIGRSSL